MERLISLVLKSARITAVLEPPLEGIHTVQLLGYHYKPKASNPSNPRPVHIDVENVYVYCDLVDSKYSYCGLTHELNPSQVLAVIDSHKYPKLGVRPRRDPIHSFNVWIKDSKGDDVRLNRDEFIRLDLRVT